MYSISWNLFFFLLINGKLINNYPPKQNSCISNANILPVTFDIYCFRIKQIPVFIYYWNIFHIMDSLVSWEFFLHTFLIFNKYFAKIFDCNGAFYIEKEKISRNIFKAADGYWTSTEKKMNGRQCYKNFFYTGEERMFIINILTYQFRNKL